MSNKMKGLLKGLRYISQIFEEEEEQEMQIGLPTDVIHVAHIGWDGPTANAPSWIQQFKEGDSGGAPQNGDQPNVPGSHGVKLPGQENRSSNGSGTSNLKSPSRRRSDKPKGSKKTGSVGTSTDSPKRTSKLSLENRTKIPPEPDSPSSTTTSSTAKTSRRRKTKTSSRSKPTSTTSDFVNTDPGED